MCVCVCVCVCMYVCVYVLTQPLHRTVCDLRLVFKLVYFLVFSFSKTGYSTKNKEPCLFYYLPIPDGFIPFQRALA